MLYQSVLPICELENLPINDSDNAMCARCLLFLKTCHPIAGKAGYALASQCDQYLCKGCTSESCHYSPIWS